MRLQLDLVDEVKVSVEQRLAQYQDLMAKHYNFKVRRRDFNVGDLNVGDLILRKVTSAIKYPSQESSVLIRKDPTESLHDKGKAPTTWRH